MTEYSSGIHFGQLFWSKEKYMVGENDKAVLPLERSRTFLSFLFSKQVPEKEFSVLDTNHQQMTGQGGTSMAPRRSCNIVGMT